MDKSEVKIELTLQGKYADTAEMQAVGVFSTIVEMWCATGRCPIAFQHRDAMMIYAFEHPGTICCTSFSGGGSYFVEAVKRGDTITVYESGSSRTREAGWVVVTPCICFEPQSKGPKAWSCITNPEWLKSPWRTTDKKLIDYINSVHSYIGTLNN